MIQLYNLYTQVKCNKFVDHVKTCLTKCFEQYFCHSIFSISIFLWPQYQDFSLSKTMVQIGWQKKWFNWLFYGILQLLSVLQLTKVCKCILLPKRMISCLVLIQFHFVRHTREQCFYWCSMSLNFEYHGGLAPQCRIKLWCCHPNEIGSRPSMKSFSLVAIFISKFWLIAIHLDFVKFHKIASWITSLVVQFAH